MKPLRYLFILFSFISFSVIAQTGIGTSTPDASAKLEVAASNKGFLPPRVALIGTNSANPISNPANGLMVFNTAAAGASPNNVVPGYYYWDGTGQQWVSISTTVGNVQNQAIYRSTSNTAANSVVSSWNSRFNNIAPGDLTFTSNTTFALSNGIYKIQWGLPHQQTNTYNTMQLQELSGGNWNAWLGDGSLANIANGGNTDWGGTSFMTDIIDCSSSTRTLRLFNVDGSRLLYYGASFIITKLNPSITTSTTADNLGNHTATRNVLLNGNYLSNEGIKIDNSGNVGINMTPSYAFDVSGTGRFSTSIINSGSRSYLGKDGGNMHWLATSDAISETNNLAYGFESNGSSIQSHRWLIGGTERMKINSNGNLGIGTGSPIRKLHVQTADATSVYVESTTSDNNGMFILNANTNQNWASGWHEFIIFQNQGSTIGHITQTNASTIAYNTTSDYRLKTDFKPFNGMDVVRKIKTYDYAWKSDLSRMYGMKAHELKEVIPYLVSGEKDAVDVNGKIIPQTVDYSKLTPILVKAIQEQDEKIQQLINEKNNLENRLKALERRFLKK
jgi:hypothetical protein